MSVRDRGRVPLIVRAFLAGAALFAAGCDPCFFVTLEDLTASASQDVKGKVRIDAQVSYVWFENFCTAEEAGKTIRFDFAHLGPVEPTRYADGSMDTTRFANGSVQQGKVIATSSFAKLETLVSYTVDNPPPPSLPPGTLAGMSGPPTDPLNQFDPGDFPLDPPPVMPGGLPSGPCPGCDPPDPPEPKCPDNDCRGSMPPWRINASNDVDLASGALTFEEFDAVIEEPGQDFTHLLSYSSADRERVGPFGRGFHYAYDRRVEAFQSAMVETDSMGNRLVHEDAADGVGYKPQALRKAQGSREYEGETQTPVFNVSQVGGVRFTYSLDSGFLTSVADLAGNRFTVERTAGVLSRIVDPVGRVIGFDADPTTGLVTRVNLPNGQAFQYGYSPRGELERITDPFGNTTQFLYEGDPGVVTRRINAKGETRQWIYDGLGRVETIVYENAAATTVEYGESAGGATVKFTDSLGKARTFEKDGEGRVVRALWPDGGVWENTWSPDGRLLRRKDPMGRVVEVAYGPEGLPSQIKDNADNTVGVVRGSPHGAATHRTNEDGSIQIAAFGANGKTERVVDATGREVVLVRGAKGLPTSIRDAAGATTSIEYNARGEAHRVVDAAGKVWLATFDEHSRPLTRTDPLGRVTRYEWLLNNRLAKVTNPAGEETTIRRDAILNVLEIVDPKGAIVRLEHQTIQGRRVLVSETDRRGFIRRWAPDSEGRIASHTDARGQVTQIGRDPVGRVAMVLRPGGGARHVQRHLDGLAHRVTEADGQQTTYLYDDLARVERIVDHQGEVTRLRRNSRGWVTGVVDRSQAETAFELDREGRVLSVLDPAQKAVARVLDARGLVFRQIDRRGNATEFARDALARVTEVKDPLAGVVRYERDDAGELTKVVDPLGREVTLVRDLAGRVVRSLGPSGEETIRTYTPTGRVATLTDPNGHTWTMSYDEEDQLTEILDPTGATQAFEYDPEGNLERMVDENGRPTTFTWDVEGRLERVTDAAGRFVRYQYDGSGRTVRITNSRGQTQILAWDPLDRLVSKTLPGTEGVETFQYDAVGRRVRATNGAVDVQTIYDAQGREVGRIDWARGFEASHELDPEGNPVTTTDSLQQTITRTFDGLNRLVSFASSRGEGYVQSYDAAGQLVERISQNRGAERRTYDDSGRLKTVEFKKLPGQELVQSFEYWYDPAGNRIREVESRAGGVSVETTYAYNARNELIEALVLTPGGAAIKGFGHMAWTYDPAGNRLSQTRDGITDTYTYDALNQIATLNGQPFSWDADGNLVREPLGPGRVRRYSWTSENLLAHLDHEDTGGGSPRIEDAFTFAYDPDGLKVTSVEEPDASAPGRARRHEQRFWSRGQLVEDRTYSQGAEATKASRRYVRAGMAMLEELRDSVSGTGVTTGGSSLFLQDAMGTPVGSIASVDAVARAPIRLVATTALGIQAPARNTSPTIAPDGEWIAFWADGAANNLVPNDNNGSPDLFFKDMTTGAIERLSLNANGQEVAGGAPFQPPPQLSRDGRFALFIGANSLVGGFPFQANLYLKDRQDGSIVAPVPGFRGSFFGMSDDARFIAYQTRFQLVPQDTNGIIGDDVYVADRQAGTFELISKSLGGVAVTGFNPSLTPDGRYVGFLSGAPDIVAGDTNGVTDLFVHDRQTGQVRRASVGADGTQVDIGITNYDISPNGRWVAFQTNSSTLVPGDTRFSDVFLKDMVTGAIEKVSEGLGTNFSGESSHGPVSVSADGRFVTYAANDVANQVPGDTNNADDVFLVTRDMLTRTTTRITLAPDGTQPNGGSGTAALSEDGRWIVFTSGATNLVPSDTNGPIEDVFLASNPAFGPTSEAAFAEAEYASYSPWGEQLAGPVGSFGFQGLRNEVLGESGVLVSAMLRHASPRLGRWISRDPGGFIDGQHRYRWNRNNPLGLVDLNGLLAGPAEGWDQYNYERIVIQTPDRVVDMSGLKKGTTKYFESDVAKEIVKDGAGRAAGNLAEAIDPSPDGSRYRSAYQQASSNTGTLLNVYQGAKTIQSVYRACGFGGGGGGGGGGDPTGSASGDPSSALPEPVVPGGSEDTFEILDGVRRSKAAEIAGKSSIRAEIYGSGGQYRDVPLQSLRSTKDVIEVDTSKRLDRWLDTLRKTMSGSEPPPILVQPGQSGIPIGDVKIGD